MVGTSGVSNGFRFGPDFGNSSAFHRNLEKLLEGYSNKALTKEKSFTTEVTEERRGRGGLRRDGELVTERRMRPDGLDGMLERDSE